MPDRASSRTVLAMLLLVLAIAGIGAAGPRVGLHAPSKAVGLTVAAALEVCLAVLLAVLRFGKASPAGPAARLRAMLSAVLIIGLLAVPVATALASLQPSHILPRRQRPPHVRTGFRPPAVKKGPGGHETVVSLRPVLIALVLAALVIALILVLYRRRRAWILSRQADPLSADDDDDAGAPAELARAVGSGQRALSELDDARTAIIRCYLAMEDSLARAGAERGSAETPDELLSRAMSAGLVAPGPAGRLTELFYEARFSTHPMPASRRDEASAALGRLAADLPEPAESEALP